MNVAKERHDTAMASNAEHEASPTRPQHQGQPSNDDHDEASAVNEDKPVNPYYLSSPTGDSIALSLTHHGTKHTLHLAPDATLSDLSAAISTHPSFQLPATHQKLLISPKPGLVKPPFSAAVAALPVAAVAARKIQLLGHAPAAVAALQHAVTAASSAHAARAARAYPVAPATPAPTRTDMDATTTYGFGAIRPLPHLANPERSAALLQRLADDAGIRSAMRTHRFRVGLLTEMDPAAHTTTASRTLGLNRNRGHVVELRLRTDAYDGYRDYRSIRRTLCHELAHNTWGDHDANFWALCRAIERHVDRADYWSRRGRTVGGSAGDHVHDPPLADPLLTPDDAVDHGGWTGGTFVLGGGESGTLSGSGGSLSSSPASRRDMMAKAAEERAKTASSRAKEGEK